MLEQFSINNYVTTLPSIQRKDICHLRVYVAGKSTGQIFTTSLSMLNCTTFFLTIWDFVHEFFEIINKRNIVSDYENEMYSFVFV